MIWKGIKILMMAAIALPMTALFISSFADGPLGGPFELVAAGPFKSGTPHTGAEPDWSFMRDHQTVEFQLLEPARSRTVWVMVHDGRPFIVSGYMNSWYGKIWKQWPHSLEEDGGILLRVDGTIYEREMVRVTDGPDIAPVLAELSRKYVGGIDIPASQVTSGNTWMFELRPR